LARIFPLLLRALGAHAMVGVWVTYDPSSVDGRVPADGGSNAGSVNAAKKLCSQCTMSAIAGPTG
jgi:hypothetical protein